jgi:hypothetical protein
MDGCVAVSYRQEMTCQWTRTNKRNLLYKSAKIRLRSISEEEEITPSQPPLSPALAGEGGEGWDVLSIMLWIRMQFDAMHLVWSHFEQKMMTGTDFAIFKFEKMDFRLY